MLLRKGGFPYDWFNSLEKLDETQLPPKDAFHSKLNNSNITDDDFEHALRVWDNFKIKTFREYHDLYMKLDVLLSTDVFENFRSVCLKNYGLDPCWYFTAPGLAWDACLKKTDVKLELLKMLILNDVDCIELNTKLRTEASSEFEKDFFKLMNNSVFGKTMENIRNGVDIRLRTDEKSAEKLVSKPIYERTTIFSEDLVAVHMKKTELVFNKPVYLGMSILDISKTLMYDFHYNYMW